MKEKYLNVFVKFSKNEKEFILKQDNLIIFLKSKPHNGESNKELLEKIKNIFKAKHVEIKIGKKNKQKIVKIIL